MLSISSCRTIRARPAPIAVRIEISLARPAARASSMFATSAHAISSTNPTAPNSTANSGRIEYAPGGGPDKRCYRVNCDKVRKALPAFRPQWTARKGAQELYDAYRANGLAADELKGGQYFRINQIQRLLETGKLDISLRWGVTALQR